MLGRGSYPEKREDMVELSDRLTVPQIFFNEKHIGGASELDHLINTEQLSKVVEELEQKPRIKDPRLEAPDYQPRTEVSAKPMSEECITIGEQCLLHAEIVNILQNKLKITTRRHAGLSHKWSFVGSEAVDLFVREFKLRSRAEGMQVGESLFHSQVFHHVSGEKPFNDGPDLYRLQIHEQPQVLNAWRVWNDRIDDPFVTLVKAKDALAQLQNKHMNDLGRIDYVALSKDEGYTGFQEAVCEFQKISISAMTLSQRKAFFINLYNLVVVHAFVQVGIPQSDLMRYSFFDKVGYQVEGYFFSLNDIENGILRNNKAAPYHLSRSFGKDDRRACFKMRECDRRIHFALNCGAASCPAIKMFTPEGIDQELDLVARAFMQMEENLQVDERKKILYTTRIVSWYKSDFGDSDLDVAQSLMTWMREDSRQKVQAIIEETGGIKVRYLPYDWSTNASMHKAYQSSNLKVVRRSYCSPM